MKQIPFVLMTAIMSVQAYAVDKVGSLEMRRYEDPFAMAKIFQNENDAFEDSECLTAFLDSQAHKAYLAVGYSMKSVTPKVVELDGAKYVVPEIVYSTAGKNGRQIVVNQPPICAISDEATEDNDSPDKQNAKPTSKSRHK